MKSTREMLGAWYPPSSLLFQLPALALALGVTLIALFIIRTEAAIAAKKRAALKGK